MEQKLPIQPPLSQGTPKLPNRPYNIILIAWAIISPLISFFGGIIYHNWSLAHIQSNAFYSQPISKTVEDPEILGTGNYKLDGSKCRFYGSVGNKQYLDVYIVKKGDTPGKILETYPQMKDELYNTIITYVNKAVESTISAQIMDEESFLATPLPAGIQISVKPKWMTGLNEFYINAYSGELAQITNTGGVMVKSMGGTSYLYPDSDTLYPDGKDLQVGECVTVLTSRDKSGTMVAIYKQKPKEN